MSTDSWVTVAAAAVHTGKSKRLIYNLINDRKLRTEETSAGMTVYLPELRNVLAHRRGPGRPRHTPESS